MKWKMLASRFGLDYLIVGIKIHKEDQPGEWKGPRITYCQAVKKVAEGSEVKIILKEFECPSPELALGFVRPRYVKIEDILENGTKCVEVSVMKDGLDADVVLFLVDAEQAMKIIATLNRGAPLNFKVSSSMALCRDATAIPILTGKPNISLLCGGARMYGRFDKNIFALGVPIKMSEIFFKKDLDLTPTEKYILHILENKGRSLSAKEIGYDSGLPDRTVRNSLQSLLKNGLIDKTTDFRDARTAMYRIKC